MAPRWQHAVVTGGAGFVGSHLCTALLDQGTRVTCVDDFCTGRPENLAHLAARPGFTVLPADVVAPFGIRVVCVEPGYFDTALSDTVDTLIDQIDPSSAYADANRFMLDFSKNALVNGGDPADVANAVVAAVADAGTPLHVHVGTDADAFLELWSRTGTFETFIPAANALLFSEG